jgi:agmatinase
MTDLLEGVAKMAQIVGLDLTEVALPYDDPRGTTYYPAARLISDFIGFITKESEKLDETNDRVCPKLQRRAPTRGD